MKKRRIGARAALLALALLSALGLGAFALYARAHRAVPADAAVVMEDKPPLIALTFDDGPRRSTTTELLDGLSQRGVKATFFLIGEQLAGNEDIVCRMDEEGHQIGIHTYDHVRLTGLNRADFDAQVGRTRQLLVNILGHNDFLLRPPYGMYDAGVQAMAGCPIILWSIDPEDWGDKNTAREVQQIVSEAQDGSIILLHDIYPTSVAAALQVVDALHEQGYLFVTIDELFAERGIALQPGEVYWNAYP
ncbi:MAG: polysaccharide deacetylase family protein [Oscillospiraceae bacterium]